MCICLNNTLMKYWIKSEVWKDNKIRKIQGHLDRNMGYILQW